MRRFQVVYQFTNEFAYLWTLAIVYLLHVRFLTDMWNSIAIVCSLGTDSKWILETTEHDWTKNALCAVDSLTQFK